MSMDDRPFRRLLRWYPRGWRLEHEKIVLSTLLDAAAHEGRSKPTPAERRGAAVHGTAARLDRRFAVVTSAAAVLCAIVGGVIWATGPDTTAWLWPVLTTGVGPAFSAFALVAVLRMRGVITDGRAIITTITAAAALALNALTVASWMLGFDAADAGLPATGLAAMWIPLGLGAWAAGGIAGALVIDAFLHRAAPRRLARIPVSVVVGVVAAPVIGVSLFFPFGNALAAVGVAVVALILPNPSPQGVGVAPSDRSTPSAPVRVVEPDAATRRRGRSTARLLAWMATASGVAGIVYAFTGAQWSAAASDTTAAMGQGITILFVSGVPLLAAVGLRVASGSPRVRPVHIWGPLTLLVVALGGLFVWYLTGASSGDIGPGFIVGAVALGGGVGWWIIPRAPLPRASAALLGVLAGLLTAAIGVLAFVVALSFAFPVAALIVALQPIPDRSKSAEASAAASPANP